MLRLVLMIWVMTGQMADKHFLKRDVGINFNSQDFAGDFEMMLRNSSSEAGVSESNIASV